MKVTMVAVCSADGFLTHGDDPSVQHWSSREDYAHFLQLIGQHKLVVMGRKTYEAVHPKPQPERLRIVLTHSPEQFVGQQIKGQLEFRSATPGELVTALGGQGYTGLLLVGGGQTNTDFLQAGLVDELWLTIEPVLFGSGVRLLTAALPDSVQLQLESNERLNAGGTLLLHYIITGKKHETRGR